MATKALIFLILFSIFYPSLARADTPDPPAVSQSNLPDVTGWKEEATYLVDFKLSDLVAVYLGFETLYSNSDDPFEYALVTKRHRPMIMAKSDPRGDRGFKQAIVNFYTKQELEDVFKKRREETDTILVQRWRVKINSRTGQPVREGDVEVWFLDSGGNEHLTLNEKVSIASISELRSNDFKEGVLAGIKYSVAGRYQIIRAEHAFLVMVLKKEKPQ